MWDSAVRYADTITWRVSTTSASVCLSVCLHGPLPDGLKLTPLYMTTVNRRIAAVEKAIVLFAATKWLKQLRMDGSGTVAHTGSQ